MSEGRGHLGMEKKVVGQFIAIAPWLVSYCINQATAMNHITIATDGDQLTFIVNGGTPFTVTDSQFAAGEVGVMAAVYDAPG